MLWGDRGEGVLGDHVPEQVVGDKLDRGTDDVDKGYSCVDMFEVLLVFQNSNEL